MNGPMMIWRGENSITKEMDDFAASHQLPTHNGKCRNLHGHNYKVFVTVQGPIVNDLSRPDHGMIIDFAVIKDVYKKKIHEVVDHSLILGTEPLEWYTQFQSLMAYGLAMHENASIDEAPGLATTRIDGLLGKVARLPVSVTTAENLAVWIMDTMNRELFDRRYPDVHVTRCTVFETDSSEATMAYVYQGPDV